MKNNANNMKRSLQEFLISLQEGKKIKTSQVRKIRNRKTRETITTRVQGWLGK